MRVSGIWQVCQSLLNEIKSVTNFEEKITLISQNYHHLNVMVSTDILKNNEKTINARNS